MEVACDHKLFKADPQICVFEAIYFYGMISHEEAVRISGPTGIPDPKFIDLEHIFKVKCCTSSFGYEAHAMYTCEGIPTCLNPVESYYHITWAGDRSNGVPNFKAYQARCEYHALTYFPESSFKVQKISKKVYLVGDMLET